MDCMHKFTMCRLCLCQNESFINIFKPNEWYEYIVAEEIKDLFQLKASRTDGYPHVICSICLSSLNDFKNFKKQCQISMNTYYELYAHKKKDSEFQNSENVVNTSKENPVEQHVVEEVPVEIQEIPIKKEPTDEEEYEETTSQIQEIPIKKEPTEEEEYEETTSQIQEIPIKKEPTDEEEYEATTSQNPISIGRPFGEDSFPSQISCDVDRSSDKVLRSSSRRGRVKKEFQQVDGSSISSALDEGSWVARKGSVKSRIKESSKHIVSKKSTVAHKNAAKKRSQDVDRNSKCNIKGEKDVISEGEKSEVTHGKTTKKKRFKCDICGKETSEKRLMYYHVRVHSGERPYPCKSCSKTFNRPDHLNRHEATHSGERNFMCDICHKGFFTRNDVTQHRKIHNKGLSFRCKFCKEGFTCKSKLQVHLRTHTGNPYQCVDCKRSFVYLTTLINHSKTHEKNEPK